MSGDPEEGKWVKTGFDQAVSVLHVEEKRSKPCLVMRLDLTEEHLGNGGVVFPKIQFRLGLVELADILFVVSEGGNGGCELCGSASEVLGVESCGDEEC